MCKEDHENFKNCNKCQICDNDYIDNDVQVRDHCNITGKYRGSAHRESNINLKFQFQFQFVISILKNSCHISQAKKL